MVKKKRSVAALIPIERVERLIYVLRGERVILDKDLAKLYGVSVKVFNQSVKRNLPRFPKDFMFQLTDDEFDDISYLTVTKRGGRRYLPYAFTEQGISMLSSILRSERAIQMNIAIMRTFVQIRHMLTSNKDLSERLNELESKYDLQFREVFDAIRKMITSEKTKKKIGFQVRA